MGNTTYSSSFYFSYGEPVQNVDYDKCGNQQRHWPKWKLSSEIGVAAVSWLQEQMEISLVAQLVRAFEQNLVIVDSNPDQANFL